MPGAIIQKIRNSRATPATLIICGILIVTLLTGLVVKSTHPGASTNGADEGAVDDYVIVYTDASDEVTKVSYTGEDQKVLFEKGWSETDLMSRPSYSKAGTTLAVNGIEITVRTSQIEALVTRFNELPTEARTPELTEIPTSQDTTATEHRTNITLGFMLDQVLTYSFDSSTLSGIAVESITGGVVVEGQFAEQNQEIFDASGKSEPDLKLEFEIAEIQLGKK